MYIYYSFFSFFEDIKAYVQICSYIQNFMLKFIETQKNINLQYRTHQQHQTTLSKIHVFKHPSLNECRHSNQPELYTYFMALFVFHIFQQYLLFGVTSLLLFVIWSLCLVLRSSAWCGGGSRVLLPKVGVALDVLTEHYYDMFVREFVWTVVAFGLVIGATKRMAPPWGHEP